MYEDGQSSEGGRPDRAESDVGDNEVSDSDDADTPARTADLGLGYTRSGTRDSLESFLAEFDDAASSPATLSEPDAPPAPTKTAAVKRPRDEAGPTGGGPSRHKAGKGHGVSKKAKAQRTAPRLEEAPLDIPPLRFLLPKLPTVAGYVSLFFRRVLLPLRLAKPDPSCFSLAGRRAHLAPWDPPRRAQPVLPPPTFPRAETFGANAPPPPTRRGQSG